MLAILAFCLTNNKLYAQSNTYLNQLVFNEAFINPGYAGSNDNGLFNIIALNRNQMASFKGAPVTNLVNINGPLKIGKVNSGVSLSIFNDKAGYLNTPGFNLGYAYRFKMLKGTAGVGLSLGLLINSLNPENGWNLPDGNNNDKAIPNQKSTKTTFDAGIGIHYTDSLWSIGISCMHLTQPSITKSDLGSKLKPDFYLSAAYRFNLPNNNDIELKPSLIVITNWATSLYGSNIQITYKKKYWAGVIYKYKTSVGALIGINLFSTLKVGYSYDYLTSSLSRYSNGSHEIMLCYAFSLITNKGKQKYKSIRYL